MKPDTNEPRMTEQFDLEVFWAKHGSKITTGALILVAAGGLALFWQRQTARRAATAAARLAAAHDAPALAAVAREFAGTETGAQALLRLADAQFRAGQFAEAGQTYQQFQTQYPRHPLLPTAALGLATVQEAQTNYTGARELYQQLAAGPADSYVRLAARLGAARCAELLGQTKEARQLYEEALAAAQGTPWEAEAYLRWVILSRDLPAEPAPAPLPATNSLAPAFPAAPGQP